MASGRMFYGSGLLILGLAVLMRYFVLASGVFEIESFLLLIAGVIVSSIGSALIWGKSK